MKEQQHSTRTGSHGKCTSYHKMENKDRHRKTNHQPSRGRLFGGFSLKSVPKRVCSYEKLETFNGVIASPAGVNIPRQQQTPNYRTIDHHARISTRQDPHVDAWNWTKPKPRGSPVILLRMRMTSFRAPHFPKCPLSISSVVCHVRPPRKIFPSTSASGGAFKSIQEPSPTSHHRVRHSRTGRDKILQNVCSISREDEIPSPEVYL